MRHPGFGRRNTMAGRLTKKDVLKHWKNACEFKTKSDELNLKASRFYALSMQVHMKMIIERMKKVLRKEKYEVK